MPELKCRGQDSKAGERKVKKVHLEARHFTDGDLCLSRCVPKGVEEGGGVGMRVCGQS